MLRKRIAGIILTAALVGQLAPHCFSQRPSERQAWPALRRLDPGLSVLQSRSRLLKIAAAPHVAPKVDLEVSGPPTYRSDLETETRLEALRALLRLQHTRLGAIRPLRNKDNNIDHVYIETLKSHTPGGVRLLATVSCAPDRTIPGADGDQDIYWSLEEFEFSKSGDLKKRLAATP